LIKKFYTKLYNKIKSNPIEAIFIGLISIILIHSLLVGTILGKADNGDFGRFYLYGGLLDKGSTYEEIYDGYFHKNFNIRHPGLLLPFGPNWVSGTLLLKLAVILNLLIKAVTGRIFIDLLSFDIRYLAILYIGIFIFSFYLIIKSFKKWPVVQILCGIFAIIFFTDVNYIGYFNSFYGEAATIVFLFLTIGSLLSLVNKPSPEKKDFYLFFIASGAFLTSKSQQIPLAIFMVIIYFALYKFYSNYKKLILKSSIVVVILCVASLLSINDYTNKNNIYQAVFTGVLYDSEDPVKDLEELGIDTKFAPLAGTNFYTENLPFDPMGEEMLKDFYPYASRAKILLYYAKHLDKFWNQFVVSAKYAYEFYDLGKNNFEKGAYPNNKPFNTLRTTLARNHKSLHKNIYIFIGFSLVFFISLCYYFIRYKDKKTRLLALFSLLLLASGASQLVLPILGSGRADFGKHLFMINLSYDIMLCAVIMYLGWIITKLIRSFKKGAAA